MNTSKLANMTFTKLKTAKTIHIQIDNIAALTYSLKIVGKKSSEMIQTVQEV